MNTNRKIVICDDNEDVKRAYELAFANSDFDLTFFTSSLEALSYLYTNKADAVLIDLAMPEMDGLTLAKEIRLNEKKSDGHRARLAWFTGRDIGKVENRVAAKYDVEEAFKKPTDPLSLIHEIKAWLSEPPPWEVAVTDVQIYNPQNGVSMATMLHVLAYIFLLIVIAAQYITTQHRINTQYLATQDRINGQDAYRVRALREERDGYRAACEENWKNHGGLIEWSRQVKGNPPAASLVQTPCIQAENIEENH